MVLQYILGKPKAESKQENCDKDTWALEHIPSVRKRTADSRRGRSGQGGWVQLGRVDKARLELPVCSAMLGWMPLGVELD